MADEANRHLRTARGLAKARSYGRCEGCGRGGVLLDPHHRRARGSGGVHGEAEESANNVVNLLMLCRGLCHEQTEQADTWQDCIRMGWRVTQGTDPAEVPALIYTVNGYGWWLLLGNGGYQWIDSSTGRTRAV